MFRLGAGANAADGGTLRPAGQPGDSTTITFRVTIDDGARGTIITNQASANYVGRALDQSFTGNSNLTRTPVPPVADLSISKTGDPASVRIGQRITYTLTVTNNGPNQAPDVTVTDDLPNEVSFVSATPSVGNCSRGWRRRDV